MTVLELYSNITSVNEQVVAGTKGLTQARIELHELKEKAIELGMIIDVEAIMYEIEKDVKQRINQLTETVQATTETVVVEDEEDDYSSSYSSSYDEDFESSY